MLHENARIDVALDNASGSADRFGNVVDTAGYDTFLFICKLGAVAASSSGQLKAQQGDQADGSDMTDLAGTGVAIADTDDNTIKFLEITLPTKRYVRCAVEKTAGTIEESAISLSYRSKEGPVAQPATSVGEGHQAPLEGAA